MPARLSSPTSVLVLDSSRPRRLASSLTPIGSAAATARSAVAWRFPSEERSIAPRIGMGAGTAFLRSWSVMGTSEVSSARSSSTFWVPAFVSLLTAMIGLLLSFDLRIIPKRELFSLLEYTRRSDMSSTAPQERRLGIVARVGGWASGHRRIVALGWLVAVVGAIFASSAVRPNYSNHFSLKGTESQRALDLLKRDFPAQSGDSDQIVFHALNGSVTAPAVQARVTPVLEQIARLPHVSGVVSPYSAAGAREVSRDGQIAFATVNFDQRANILPKSATERVIAVAHTARSPQLEVQLGGQAIEQVERVSLGAATAVGLLAAMIVLLITFGSLLAMGLPILTALLGLGTGIGLAGLASQVVSTPDFATQLAVMIG